MQSGLNLTFDLSSRMSALRGHSLSSTGRANLSFLINAAKEMKSPVAVAWKKRTSLFMTTQEFSSDPSSSDKVKGSSGSVGQADERHPDAEKDPLPEWPEGVNPETGEKGGPKGPEPTRYGDWERKGRVSDF